MPVNVSSVVKQLMCVLKLFRVIAGSTRSFQMRSKKRFGSFMQSIRFSIWSKESASVVDHLDQLPVLRV